MSSNLILYITNVWIPSRACHPAVSGAAETCIESDEQVNYLEKDIRVKKG